MKQMNEWMNKWMNEKLEQNPDFTIHKCHVSCDIQKPNYNSFVNIL